MPGGSQHNAPTDHSAINGEVAERLTHSPGANGDAQRAPEG